MCTVIPEVYWRTSGGPPIPVQINILLLNFWSCVWKNTSMPLIALFKLCIEWHLCVRLVLFIKTIILYLAFSSFFVGSFWNFLNRQFLALNLFKPCYPVNKLLTRHRVVFRFRFCAPGGIDHRTISLIHSLFRDKVVIFLRREIASALVHTSPLFL